MRFGGGLGIGGRRRSQSGPSGPALPATIVKEGHWAPRLNRLMNGSTVQAMADQSGKSDGSNRTLLQLTPAAQSAVVTADAGYNGIATCTMNGTSTFYRTSAWTAPPTQPYEYYLIGHITSFSGNRVLVDGLTTATASLAYTGGTGVLNLDSGAAFTIAAPALTSKFILCISWNGVSSKYSINRKTLTATGNLGAKNITGISLGAYADGGLFWNGVFAELLVIKPATDAERGAIHDFYSSLYGITVAA